MDVDVCDWDLIIEWIETTHPPPILLWQKEKKWKINFGLILVWVTHVFVYQVIVEENEKVGEHFQQYPLFRSHRCRIEKPVDMRTRKPNTLGEAEAIESLARL